MYYPIYGIIPFMVLSHLWYFPPYFFCKVNANERNESLLSNCRVQLNFCKVNANERNGKEILSFYLLRSMISIIFLPSSNHLYIFLHAIFISIFRPCPKSFLRLRSIPIKSPQPPSPPLSYIKNEAAIGLKSPLAASFFIYQIREIILYISLPRIKSSFIYLFQR